MDKFDEKVREGSGHECAAISVDIPKLRQLAIEADEDSLAPELHACLNEIEALRAAQPCPAPPGKASMKNPTIVELELNTSNWMRWADIPTGMWFIGNPKAIVGKPPNYSGAMGESLYVKTIDGSLFAPTGSRNYGVEHLDDHWMIDGYRPLHRVRIEAVPDQKIAEEMPEPPRCEVCGNYIRPHESIHYNSNYDLVHDGCRPRKIAEER